MMPTPRTMRSLAFPPVSLHVTTRSSLPPWRSHPIPSSLWRRASVPFVRSSSHLWHICAIGSLLVLVHGKNRSLSSAVRASPSIPALELHSVVLPCRSFFATTPLDLIDDGLYNDLAVPLIPGRHFDVSIALLAKRLGATHRTAKSVLGRAMEGLFSINSRPESSQERQMVHCAVSIVGPECSDPELLA